MLFGLGTRRMGRVGTRLAFVSSMVVRTAATAAVVRPGQPGGLRRGTGGGGAQESPPPVGAALIDHDHVEGFGGSRVRIVV